MGKLRNLAAPIGRLPSRVGGQRDVHGHSRAAEPWRLWYSLKRWRDLKAAVHLRDLYTCREAGCRRLIQDARERVADHVEPHHGDPALFWDEGNVQTLCKSCHDRVKQAAERRAGREGLGPAGR